MSDKKGKSFIELLNGQELDLDVLNWLEITRKFEEFFKNDEFLTGYDGKRRTTMSKADKMLEELGFKRINETTYELEKFNMELNFVDKGLYISTGEPWINNELYKAIHEKMKELGWLDD